MADMTRSGFKIDNFSQTTDHMLDTQLAYQICDDDPIRGY